jgi:hypothetical protein
MHLVHEAHWDCVQASCREEKEIDVTNCVRASTAAALKRTVLLPAVSLVLAGALALGVACRSNPALTFDPTELDTVALFLGKHAQTMREDGAKMVDAGRAHNDAHVIADGQHQIADAAQIEKLRDQVVAMAGELRNHPLTGSRLDVDRALSNGRTLEAEAQALKAHADAMIAHGNLMRDLSHQPGNDWMLEGAEAMLRDTIQLGEIATRLQDVGAAMIQFSEDVKRSLGAR